MDDQQHPGYSVKQWAGYPLYQCNDCAFNSTVETVIQDHCIGHGRIDEPSEAPSGLVLVADKNGHEIELATLSETDEISAEDLLALVAKKTPQRRRR